MLPLYVDISETVAEFALTPQEAEFLGTRLVDDVVKEYNSRQKREDRKIKDYFEHVAGLNQDMAVEIIF